jgi:uracil phosphoribosyltransferase
MTDYTHFTDIPSMQVMATKSRDSSLSGHLLSQVHKKMGEYLGQHIIGLIGLEEIEFQHVQGIRKGFAVSTKSNIVILPLLRAGLFAGLGIWDSLPSAAFVPITPIRGEKLANSQVKGMPSLNDMIVIVADAVINTGGSLEPVINWILEQNPHQIIVSSLVTPVPTAKRLAVDYPNVEWVHARVSNNQYVGKGGTDTGNRLFNTK